MKFLKLLWNVLSFAALWLMAACSEPKMPEPIVDHKAMCELKTSTLVTAANQAGLSCKEVKPGLDMILSFDPDCKAYFGEEKVAVQCDD